ncbi:MAG TPA: response regulator transcription factor [Myxococcales bacterium]|jgi:DNA-binding NarL/FixJ family response regulator
MTAAQPAPPRVFLVEDHPTVCLGLRLLLEQAGIQVCGEAQDCERALEALRDPTADLAIVDLSLGGEDGLDLLRSLAKKAPALPLLVYSMHEDATHVSRAFKAGARGYVTKRESADTLVHCIRECLAGRSFASPRAAQSLAEVPAGTSGTTECLSLQEQKVYDQLGQGFSLQEIATQLGVSRSTVETYFGRIQVKLGLQDMRELRRHAIAHRP